MFTFYLIGCFVAFLYAVLRLFELKSFDIKLYISFVFAATILSWVTFIIVVVLYTILFSIDQMAREESEEYDDYDEDF